MDRCKHCSYLEYDIDSNKMSTKTNNLKCIKSATQIMTLNIVDFAGQDLDEPFDIIVSYVVIGNIVNLYIPAFNFSIASAGWVYTLDGFLPREIWPNDPTYQSFFIGNNNEGENFQVHVTNAGSLNFLPTEGNNEALFFSPGAHAVAATTVTYMLTGSIFDFKPPKNIIASTDTSNAVISGSTIDFAEYHIPAIYNNKIAVWWPDNSVEFSTPPDARQHLNVAVRTATVLTNKCGKSKIIFDGPPQIAISSKQVNPSTNGEHVYLSEGQITINPTDPTNIAVASILRDANYTVQAADGDPIGQDNLFQEWIAVSKDGGRTWNSRRLITRLSDGSLLRPRDGTNLLFDRFGNLWAVNIYASKGEYITLGLTTGQTFVDKTAVSVSTNGGDNFIFVGAIDVPVPVDINTQFRNFFDFPQTTFGGDGQNGFALWGSVSYIILNQNFTAETSRDIVYLPVRGSASNPNNIGSLTLLQIPQTVISPNNLLYMVPLNDSIAVGDNGKMMILGGAQTWVTSTPPENSVAELFNPTGITNFDLPHNTTGSAFSGPFWVAKSNINVTTIVPFQPARGIADWAYGLAYDPDTDRFYAAIIDMQPRGSNNMVLYLLYTENGGQTWSKPVLISDTIKKARGELNMFRDPVTGNILFSWLDARCQEDQTNVNTFITLVSKTYLDSLPTLTTPLSERSKLGIQATVVEDENIMNPTEKARKQHILSLINRK